MVNQKLNNFIKANTGTNINSKINVQKLVRKNTVYRVVSLMVILMLFSSIGYTTTLSGETHLVVATYPVNVTVNTEQQLRDAVNTAKGATSEYVIALADDITLTSATLSIPSTANVVLTSEGTISRKLIGPNNIDTITIAGNSKLILDGIIVTHTKGQNGRGININSGGTLILNSGEISCNTVTVDGGGVYNGGVFVVSGDNCVIANNTSTGSGGGVYTGQNRVFEVLGGNVIIANNTAARGGGVYNWYGSFVVSGDNCVIANNTVSSNGGGVWSRETFKVSGDNALIANNKAGYGGGVYVDGGIFEVSGDNVVIANNIASSNGGGVYNRLGSFEVSGANMVIASSTANNGGGLYNDNSGKFIVSGYNCVIANNTARSYGGGVWNWGSFEVSGDNVMIANNTAAFYGGGMYISDGTVTLSGDNCVIANNTATRYNGGGVAVNSGSFTMFSGEITYNTAASDGGGVYNTGTFEIAGDNIVIANNKAGVDGGGVYTRKSFVVSGDNCVISGNTAGDNGGGVYNYINGKFVSKFVVSGDNMVIANNTAIWGGGVCNEEGIVEISGGIIVNNTAAYGGGIFDWYGSFVVSGDNMVIANNTVTSDGGGIYTTLSFEMSGDTVVTNNTACRNGGGVYVASGTFKMTGGKIADNVAVSGGGIYVYGDSVELLAGVISGNAASGNGGGIWVTDTTTNLDRLTVANDAVFSNNIASGAYNIDPAHNSYYNVHIGSNVIWSEPFTQGYNNYDISYVNGPQILYHIKYNPNTGTGSMSNTATIYNKNITLKPNTFSNAGYTFTGWNTATDGTGDYYTDNQTFNYTCTYDLQLYAQWTSMGYSVIYDANGGNGAPVDNAVYQVGDTVTVLSEVPTKSGYIFAGWLYNKVTYADKDTFTLFDVDGDVVLTAQWTKTAEPIFYTLTYNGNGHTSGAVPLGGTYPAGYHVLVVAPGSMICEGYVFLGWAYTPDATKADFVIGTTGYIPLTKDTTLYAVWKTKTNPPALTYTVTYLPGTYGTFKAVTHVCTLGDLTPQAPVVSGQLGWKFIGWTPQPTSTVEGDATYAAQWEQVVFVVKFVDWDGTVLKTESVSYGNNAYAPANPSRAGYTFAGWNPANFTNITTTDLTVTAEYTQNNNKDNNNSDGSGNNNGNNSGSQINPPATTPPPSTTTTPSTATSPPSTTPPLSSGDSEESLQSWALVNLVLSVAGLILTIGSGVWVLLQHKQNQKKAHTNDDDMEAYIKQNGRQRNVWLEAAFALGIAGVVVFLFTEDLSRTMTLVDNWTMVNAFIFAVQLAAQLTSLTLICKHKKIPT
jgi:uncharacterized repeat protein (TIGR02543 family)